MNKSMQCKEVSDLLLDYIEGESTPELSERIRAHLKACERCRREEAEMRDLISEAGRASDAEPSPGYFEYLYPRIKARMQEEGLPVGSPAIPSTAQRLRDVLGGWHLAYALASFLIVAAAVVLTIRIVDTGPGPGGAGEVELAATTSADPWHDAADIVEDLESEELTQVAALLSDEVYKTAGSLLEQEEEDGLLSLSTQETLAGLETWQIEQLAEELELDYKASS